MDIVIGTCSSCGGAVMVPEFWSSVAPAPKKCVSCGAEAAEPYGAVIQMKPQRFVKNNFPVNPLEGLEGK